MRKFFLLSLLLTGCSFLSEPMVFSTPSVYLEPMVVPNLSSYMELEQRVRRLEGFAVGVCDWDVLSIEVQERGVDGIYQKPGVCYKEDTTISCPSSWDLP